MKNAFLFLLLSIAGATQAQRLSHAAIDAQMQYVAAPTPDSLGRYIKSTYTTDAERTRAVYAWISSHIAYNTAVFKPRRAVYQYSPDPFDTAAVWPSGDEMVARKAMRTGLAVCDGYSRLFKTVCDYAGIEAGIVQGFARGVNSSRFRTNHSWNAVRIDSAWHLLDVTWASGYLTGADDFVRQQNDYWYLTPPGDFIRDHHPENLRWALLNEPTALMEFKRSPMRTKNFSKYGISRTWPEVGVIETAVGDTVEFRLNLNDAKAAKAIGNDPFVSTDDWLQSPASVFLSPDEQLGKEVVYRYVVDDKTSWIHLTYNSDVVLRYQLKIGAKKEDAVAAK